MNEKNTVIIDDKKYIAERMPNWAKLTELIEKAKGPDKSMGAFAELCNLSPATFTRVVKGYYIKPLKVDILKCIFENAVPGADVTMDALLHANGFVPINEAAENNAVEDNAIEDNAYYRYLSGNSEVADSSRLQGQRRVVVNNSINIGTMYEIITSEFDNRNYPYVMYSANGMADGNITESKLGLDGFDRYKARMMLIFHIQGIEPRYLKFHGNLINEDMIETVEDLWRHMKPYFYIFLRDAWEPETTEEYSYIIVFTKEKAFEIFVEVMNKVKINNYISAILVDKKEMKVVKEFAVPRKQGETFTIFK